MKIRIYQINTCRDENSVKFESLKDLQRYQGSAEIDASIYDRVFAGDVVCENLEEVYVLFNLKGHPLHRGHSLSVSDVVEVEDGDHPGCYYCDKFGFATIIFQPEQAHAPDNLIRVLVIEPNRKPYESEVENTLKGQQRAVQGNIQYLYNNDDTIFVVNEEHKFNGMEGNRHIPGDVIAGPFFIAGDTGEELCSLNDTQIKKYAEQFAEPEEIPPEEINAFCSLTLITW